ncbi:MAG: hypothetical protein AB7S71_22840 [Dongiaceae bacterium]
MLGGSSVRSAGRHRSADAIVIQYEDAGAPAPGCCGAAAASAGFVSMSVSMAAIAKPWRTRQKH